ncbi:MAG: IPT/TIG domain-containing protein [Rubrivivax sp.]|nr:IPT/TIG domain-containing protein [Rubrivivax sp.]
MVPGVATAIRVSTSIADPSVIGTSVNLQRVSETGAVIAVLGTLRDDGLEGDDVAGDGTFTLVREFNETAPVRLRVSAGFRGLLRRVNSPDALLPLNTPPVADAGRTLEAAVGDTVFVSGEGSRDADNDLLLFEWKLEAPAGSGAALDDGARARPSFKADRAGEYLLALRVFDGLAWSPPARTSVSATAPEARPTADAGDDQDLPTGTIARLDAGRSVGGPGAISFNWTVLAQPAGSDVSLSDPTSVQATVLLAQPGLYRFGLMVTDASATSLTDEVLITVHGGNTPPTAVPGSRQVVNIGAAVSLDASASFDPDAGDSVAAYRWRFVAIPTGFVPPAQPAAYAAAAFTFAASLAGDYVLELVVTDSRGAASRPRRVLVRAGAEPNPRPVLNRISPDQAIAGSAALVIAAEGRGFNRHTVLWFGASPITTRFISATRLEADVPAALLSATGTVAVLTRNPAPGGGDSGTRSFQVLGGAPVLNAVSPSVLEVGRDAVLTLGGTNFRPGAVARLGNAGLATTFVAATSLTALVPAALLIAPGTLPLRVVDPGGAVSNGLDVQVVVPLALDSVTPLEGPPGTVVVIRGSGFGPAATTQVSIGTRTAGIRSLAADRIEATIPLVAATGPIRVSTDRGAITGPVFTVRREQDFGLLASPAELPTYAGGSATIELQLQSLGPRPFTGVATLGSYALPPGAALRLSNPVLGAGQSASAVVSLAPGVAPGTYPIGIEARATIDGTEVLKTAAVNLVVRPGTDVAGVSGRFVDPRGAGLQGVIVRAENPALPGDYLASTTTDAAGNFLLGGLPPGELTLRFDSTPVGPGFPIWPQAVWVEPGRITAMAPWTLRPLPPAGRFTPIVPAHSADQTVTNPDFPGLSITIPAGTTIVGWDGVTRTRASVTKIAPDKLPTGAPLGGAKSYFMISFGSSMGGIPTNGAKVAVSAPNDLGLAPGEKGELWYYHGMPQAGSGGWKRAGTGTVSADGKTIATDAGVGIDRFCGVCGLWCFIAKDGVPNDCPDCTGGPAKHAGNPVSLTTGIETARTVDLVIDGVMPITLGRVYHPWDTFIANADLLPGMGHGWSFSYDHILYAVAGVQRLVFAGNSRVDMAPDGTGGFVAPQDPRLRGARLSATAAGWELKFKDGRRWLFNGFGLINYLTHQIDPSGNRLVIERNANGRPTNITAPGRAVVIGIGGAGFIESIRDELGREIIYRYAGSRLEEVRATDGKTTRYTYHTPEPDRAFNFAVGAAGSGGGGGAGTVSLSSGIGPMQSANGPVFIRSIDYPGSSPRVQLEYSHNHRVLRQSHSGLTELRFAYELSGGCAVLNPAITMPDGTLCAGPDGPTEESTETHNAGWRFFGGKVIATTVTDGNGNSYKTKFNSAGFGIEVIDALRQVTTYERDALNQVTAVADAAGRTTRYEYDGAGNRTAIVDALAQRTDITYHPLWNKPVAVTRRMADGTPITYRFEYDDAPGADGRLVSMIDPLSNVTRYEYTDAGPTVRALVSRIVDPLGHAITLRYNDRGDVIAVLNALGHKVSLARIFRQQ